jgi:hypothetical protein
MRLHFGNWRNGSLTRNFIEFSRIFQNPTLRRPGRRQAAGAHGSFGFCLEDLSAGKQYHAAAM